LDGFPGGNGQHNASMLNLEECQVAAVCHGSQDGSVSVRDGQETRLSATHGGTSDTRAGAAISSIPVATNLLHYFCPDPLGLLVHYPPARIPFAALLLLCAVSAGIAGILAYWNKRKRD
jgi:hypothetical protein